MNKIELLLNLNLSQTPNLFQFVSLFLLFYTLFQMKMMQKLAERDKTVAKANSKEKGLHSPNCWSKYTTTCVRYCSGDYKLLRSYDVIKVMPRKHSWRHAFRYDLTYVLSQSLKLDFLNIIRFVEDIEGKSYRSYRPQRTGALTMGWSYVHVLNFLSCTSSL